MTCMMLSRSCAEEYDLNTPSAKLNHRRFRALLKKLRRKKIRQKAAQERDRLLQVEEKVPLSPCQEEQEQEEQEKQRQHELWLEREAEAQREFKQRCRLEEERETVLANRAKGASQEESLEKVLAQLPVASPSLPPTSREESWHNPPAPSTYAPAEPCPFYLKTGACRFGDCEEEARRALTMLNGRWYAGRPVSCEFSPVDRWKTAVCGLFFRRACPKGRGCNFLHVFRNPTDECWHESRSPPPQRQHSHSPVAKRRRQSRSPHRSHKRSRASRSRSKSKDQKKRRRHELRSRSRSRSRKSVTRSSRSKHR
ncbi:U2 small nuclear ribonucleoprotein auxiliary factor 35 kDa subunit-related protein 2-like isoform X4 [Dermacentor albipictus]|uniref:U2 small nuclear ribonucleoprotein auxiliary factor 35 kDa subunit-related protein 2-like isoform X4 n=1 Tax=Dermacentor albipictus TaxID=60249 RepID=UPI0038FD1B26